MFVFYSAANVGDFCSFKGYISHFRSNEMHFCNYLGRGLNIPEYKGNIFLDPKSLVGSYGDTLLKGFSEDACIFRDLSKAVEAVDHTIIFDKLILGDPGADSRGEGKSKQAEKYGTKEK